MSSEDLQRSSLPTLSANGYSLTVKGISPSLVSTSATLLTGQYNWYFPGGNVGALANNTCGADCKRGWSVSTTSPSRLTTRTERMWSTGLSKRTENAVLRPSIVVFAAGTESKTWTVCAQASAGSRTNAPHIRATNVKCRKVIIGDLPCKPQEAPVGTRR